MDAAAFNRYRDSLTWLPTSINPEVSKARYQVNGQMIFALQKPIQLEAPLVENLITLSPLIKLKPMIMEMGKIEKIVKTSSHFRWNMIKREKIQKPICLDTEYTDIMLQLEQNRYELHPIVRLAQIAPKEINETVAKASVLLEPQIDQTRELIAKTFKPNLNSTRFTLGKEYFLSDERYTLCFQNFYRKPPEKLLETKTKSHIISPSNPAPLTWPAKIYISPGLLKHYALIDLIPSCVELIEANSDDQCMCVYTSKLTIQISFETISANNFKTVICECDRPPLKASSSILWSDGPLMTARWLGKLSKTETRENFEAFDECTVWSRLLSETITNKNPFLNEKLLEKCEEDGLRAVIYDCIAS